MSDTLGHRPKQCFWGWGYPDEALSAAEIEHLRDMARLIGVSGDALPAPTLADFELRAPRIAAPGNLLSILSDRPYDRASHTYGKSFADLVRLQMRDMSNPPDWVAFPRNEDDLSALMDFAAASGAALVPFGGGTSVCGGVEPDIGGDYPAVISVDLQYLNKVLEIDRDTEYARLEQEREVTRLITELAHLAREEGDLVGEQFLAWFLAEQREEEASMADLVHTVERAGETNILLAEDYLARNPVGDAGEGVGAPEAAGGAL